MSFVAGVDSNKTKFESDVRMELDDIASKLGVELDISDKYTIKSLFSKLIRRTKHKYGKNVVIIIDEYDKPILDLIDKPKMEGV